MKKKEQFAILKELDNIKKINGMIRTASVAIESSGGARRLDPAVYGSALDSGEGKNQQQNYHFSDWDESKIDYFSDPEIKESIDGIGSGKRRPAEELDRITARMAEMTAEKVVDFIVDGAHLNYQWWKNSSTDNLYDTGKLLDSIVGVAKRKDGTIIWRGR